MTSCFDGLKYHCIERSDEKQSRLHPTFGQQDVIEMSVQIHRTSVKNRPKQLENRCRIALGRLLESFWMHFWSSICDSEACGMLQSGKRELLEPLWGTLGTPLGSTRGALGSFWAPCVHLWKAFGVPPSAKADFLKIVVFL